MRYRYSKQNDLKCTSVKGVTWVFNFDFKPVHIYFAFMKQTYFIKKRKKFVYTVAQ